MRARVTKCCRSTRLTHSILLSYTIIVFVLLRLCLLLLGILLFCAGKFIRAYVGMCVCVSVSPIAAMITKFPQAMSDNKRSSWAELLSCLNARRYHWIAITMALVRKRRSIVFECGVSAHRKSLMNDILRIGLNVLRFIFWKYSCTCVLHCCCCCILVQWKMIYVQLLVY